MDDGFRRAGKHHEPIVDDLVSLPTTAGDALRPVSPNDDLISVESRESRTHRKGVVIDLRNVHEAPKETKEKEKLTHAFLQLQGVTAPKNHVVPVEAVKLEQRRQRMHSKAQVYSWGNQVLIPLPNETQKSTHAVSREIVAKKDMSLNVSIKKWKEDGILKTKSDLREMAFEIERKKQADHEAHELRSKYKRGLTEFRTKLKDRLKEQRDPLRGSVMRFVDEGFAHSFIEKFDGNALSVETALGMIGSPLGKTTANSIEMAKMVILPTDQLYVDPASGAVQLVVPAANSPTVQPPSWNPFRNGKPTKLRASNGGGGGGGLSTNAKQPLTGHSPSTSTMSPPRDRRARVPDEGVSGVTQGVAGALQGTRTMLQDGVMGGDPHGADSGKGQGTVVSLEGTGTVEGVESGFYQVSHHALPPGTIVEGEPSIAPSVLALPSTTLSEAFAMDIDNDNDNGNSPLQGFISRDSRDSSQQWTPSMSRETSFSSLLHPLVRKNTLGIIRLSERVQEMTDETPREEISSPPAVTPMPEIKDSDVDDWSHHTSDNPSAQPSRDPISSLPTHAVATSLRGAEDGLFDADAAGKEEDNGYYGEDNGYDGEEAGNASIAVELTATSVVLESDDLVQSQEEVSSEAHVEGGSGDKGNVDGGHGSGGNGGGPGVVVVAIAPSRLNTPTAVSLRSLVTGLSLDDEGRQYAMHPSQPIFNSIIHLHNPPSQPNLSTSTHSRNSPYQTTFSTHLLNRDHPLQDNPPILGSGLDEDAQELQGQGLGLAQGQGLGQISATSVTGSIDDESHAPLYPTGAAINPLASPDGTTDDPFSPTPTTLIRSTSTGHHVKTIRSTLNLKQMNLGTTMSAGHLILPGGLGPYKTQTEAARLFQAGKSSNSTMHKWSIPQRKVNGRYIHGRGNQSITDTALDDAYPMYQMSMANNSNNNNNNTTATTRKNIQPQHHHLNTHFSSLQDSSVSLTLQKSLTMPAGATLLPPTVRPFFS